MWRHRKNILHMTFLFTLRCTHQKRNESNCWSSIVYIPHGIGTITNKWNCSRHSCKTKQKGYPTVLQTSGSGGKETRKKTGPILDRSNNMEQKITSFLQNGDETRPSCGTAILLPLEHLYQLMNGYRSGWEGLQAGLWLTPRFLHCLLSGLAPLLKDFWSARLFSSSETWQWWMIESRSSKRGGLARRIGKLDSSLFSPFFIHTFLHCYQNFWEKSIFYLRSIPFWHGPEREREKIGRAYFAD